MEEKENLEKGIKKVTTTAKKLLSKPLTRKAVIVIAIFALIIVLTGSAYDALTDAFSNRVSDHVTKNPVKYNTKDNSINIDEETINGLSDVIKDMGISLSSLGLTKEDLGKLYAAEVVSSEINRAQTEQEDKYYGRVFIKRENQETGELENLIYVPLDEFEKMTSPDILGYFSIVEDENSSDFGKLCVANVITENGVDTITISKLNYKDNISQYSVPVEFLLDLCLITQNPGFVKEFADRIIKETEIVIQVLQEENTTITNGKITYTLKTEGTTTTSSYDSEGKYQGSSTDSFGPSYDKDQEEEIPTHTQVVINSKIKVQYVKNWIMEEKYTYSRVDNPETTIDLEPETLENESPVTTSDSATSEYEDGSYEIIDTTTTTQKIDRQKHLKLTTSSKTYQEGVSEGVVNKLEDFVALLKTPMSQPNSFQKIAAVGKLENGAGLFLQMLRNGERTQNLEQLMSQIIDACSDPDYDFNNININIFKIRSFSVVGSDYMVDISQKDAGQYITNVADLKKALKQIYTGNTLTNLEGQANSFIEMQNKYNVDAVFAVAVTIAESSGGTNWSAIDSSTYNWMSVTGSYNGKTYKNPNSSNPRTWRVYPNFKEAVMDFGNLIANDIYYFKNGKYTVKQIAPTYCSEEWGNTVVAEMTKIYKAAGIKISSATGLLEAADNVAVYLEENNYTYKGTDQVNYTFPIQDSTRRTLSCSSYVQECLLQAGYTQCAGGEKLWARKNSALSVQDFKNLGIDVELITDMNQLQPGDILQFGTTYHIVIVYSKDGNNVTVKGVPEVLNTNQGFGGKTHTITNLKNKGCYALRIVS